MIEFSIIAKTRSTEEEEEDEEGGSLKILTVFIWRPRLVANKL